MNKTELKRIMGENLRKAREDHRYTMLELAAQMEITPGYLGLIERGKRGLTAYMIYRISELFKLSVNSLFENRSNKSTRNGKYSGGDGLVCFMPIIVYPRRHMAELKEEIERLKQDAAVNENRAFELLTDIFTKLDTEAYFYDAGGDTDEETDEEFFGDDE